VHDTTQLEAAGIPSVFVASSEFEDATEAQARSLGLDPAAVYVEHPIQDRSNEEMVVIADKAVDALVAAITHPGP